jgi:NAD(P)-dependent dehydrogenase (short-subunit alcohol dehydrogenase family)
MRDLKDMSVLVTGGGSGLGEGTARHLAGRGAKVTICGRRADKIEAAAAAIGPNCRGVAGDITDAGDRRRILDAALEHGGGLGSLVNCAGNMYRGAIAELDPDKLHEVFDSNIIAPMLLTGIAVEHLAKTRGSVVFFGSVHTRRSYPGASPEGVTRVLAAELGPQGICVNCVIPGAVPTELNLRAGLFADEESHLKRLEAMIPQHPLGRIGAPEDIAEGVEYLIRADWVTGISLVIDGGLALGLTHA